MNKLGFIKKSNNNIKLGFITPFLKVGDGDDKITDTPEFKEALSAALEASKEESKNAIAKAVEEATNGLNSKNAELLDELKTAKSNLKKFEGVDIDSVSKMMEQINQSEELKLISEGKFDEVLQKRMDTVNAKHQEETSTLQKALEEALENSNKYKSTLEKNTISDSVRSAALKAGILPEALDDVVRRGLDIFSIDEEGKIEARDENGNLLTIDELLVTPERFIDSLKKSAKHYWGSSEGAGAEGNKGENKSGSGSGEGLVEIATNEKGFDLDAYRKKRKAMSGDDYNKRR